MTLHRVLGGLQEGGEPGRAPKPWQVCVKAIRAGRKKPTDQHRHIQNRAHPPNLSLAKKASLVTLRHRGFQIG